MPAIIRNLTETRRWSQLTVVIDEDLLTSRWFVILIRRERVEATKRDVSTLVAVAEVHATLTFAAHWLLVRSILLSWLFRSEVTDPSRVLFRLEAVLLLREQVTHRVPLARIHG